MEYWRIAENTPIPIANAAAKAEYAQSKVNTEGARLSLQRVKKIVARLCEREGRRNGEHEHERADERCHEIPPVSAVALPKSTDDD